MYLIVYGYSAHKTSVAPNETYWAYICMITVGYLFIRISKFILSLPDKKPVNSEKNSEDPIAN